jgi:hypothetical protein
VGKEEKGKGKRWAAGLGFWLAHAGGGEVGRGCGSGQGEGVHIFHIFHFLVNAITYMYLYVLFNR